MQPGGNRLISLELGPVALALLASGDRDREMLDGLIERLGRERAVESWFRLRGLNDWADRYQFLAGLGQDAAMEAADYAHA